MAPWALVLLLDRLSGRPSFSPSTTIGASVLTLPILRRAFTSQSCHRSAAGAGNPGFTSDSGVIATAGADQLSLPLQAAVNYSRHSTTTISAAASLSTPRIELISPPRALPAPSTTNFYGLLRLRQRPYRSRKPHRHRFALRVPHHRHSRPIIAFYWTIDLHQRSNHSSKDATTTPLRAWRALPYPLKTIFSFSIGPFLESLHHPFPQQSRAYQDHRPACTLHAFTVRQLRIREPATPRYTETSSRGIIAFSLSLSFLGSR